MSGIMGCVKEVVAACLVYTENLFAEMHAKLSDCLYQLRSQFAKLSVCWCKDLGSP